MKAFIALCFIAMAFAEPEADPYLFYNNYVASPYYQPTVYNTGVTGYPYAYSSYAHYPYASTYYSRLFKREAEAEAEADPLFYYNTYPTAYSYPTAYYNAPVVHKTYTHAVPTTAYAYHPSVAAFPATHVTQTNGAAVSSTAGVHSGVINPFVGGYANAGNYVAKSGSTVHIAKRDAEAEADPYYFYNNAFAYGSAYPYRSAYTYSPYRYTAYAGFRPYGRYFF